VKPLFSILLPVYNVASYLSQCLDSILSQTCGDWELIAVDDSSTDNSGSFLDSYASRDSRIRVRHLASNSGVAVARNIALSMVRGEYVVFVDGDDLVRPAWLSHIRDAMLETGADYVKIGHLEFLSEITDSQDETTSTYNVIDTRDAIDDWGWRNFATDGCVCGGAYRSEILKGVEFPVGVTFSEDSLFGFAATGRINKVCLSKYSDYLYRQREGSAIHSRLRSKACLNYLIACRRAFRDYGQGTASAREVMPLFVWRMVVRWVTYPADNECATDIRKELSGIWHDQGFRLQGLKWHWRIPALLYLFFGWRRPIRIVYHLLTGGSK